MLAVSWVFPPTRMCTEPARCTKLDMRFRKGTCKNVLGKGVKRIKKRMIIKSIYEFRPTAED